MVRRLGTFLLLVALLIPATVLPDSGDGDIPERRVGGCTATTSPQTAWLDDMGESSLPSGPGWPLGELWVYFLETIDLLQ